jgi:hypothetical protein
MKFKNAKVGTAVVAKRDVDSISIPHQGLRGVIVALDRGYTTYNVRVRFEGGGLEWVYSADLKRIKD